MDADRWQEPRTYEWLQPTSSGPFVLVTGGGQVGTMARKSWTGETWLGESAVRRWRFRPTGFWARRYEALDPATSQVLATYTMKWHAAEGTLTLSDGRAFQWRQKSLFGGTAVFEDASGREVLTLSPGRAGGHRGIADFFRTQGTVTTAPGQLDSGTVALLVFFAWFLLLIRNEEAAASAATTAAVA